MSINGVIHASGRHLYTRLAAGTGAIPISEHLFGIATSLLTIAGGIAIAVAPGIYRDWRAGKRQNSKQDGRDAEHATELHDLAELQRRALIERDETIIARDRRIAELEAKERPNG